jgi:hypothetical protein
LAVFGELVLQQLHALPQKPVVVIQLQHIPRLTGVGIEPEVARGLVRGHRNLMGADVVRMRVAAILVVGGHHVRLEFADHTHQLFDGLLQRHHAEAAVGQRWRRIALGESGVDKTEPMVLHAEDLSGLGHLVAPDLGHPAVHLGQVHRRVEDVAALAAGERDDQHADALVGVAGHGGGTLAGLVVRVGVHRHQTQFTQLGLSSWSLTLPRRFNHLGSPIVPVLVDLSERRACKTT